MSTHQKSNLLKVFIEANELVEKKAANLERALYAGAVSAIKKPSRTSATRKSHPKKAVAA